MYLQIIFCLALNFFLAPAFSPPEVPLNLVPWNTSISNILPDCSPKDSITNPDVCEKTKYLLYYPMEDTLEFVAIEDIPKSRNVYFLTHGYTGDCLEMLTAFKANYGMHTVIRSFWKDEEFHSNIFVCIDWGLISGEFSFNFAEALESYGTAASKVGDIGKCVANDLKNSNYFMTGKTYVKFWGVSLGTHVVAAISSNLKFLYTPFPKIKLRTSIIALDPAGPYFATSPTFGPAIFCSLTKDSADIVTAAHTSPIFGQPNIDVNNEKAHTNIYIGGFPGFQQFCLIDCHGPPIDPTIDLIHYIFAQFCGHVHVVTLFLESLVLGHVQEPDIGFVACQATPAGILAQSCDIFENGHPITTLWSPHIDPPRGNFVSRIWPCDSITGHFSMGDFWIPKNEIH